MTLPDNRIRLPSAKIDFSTDVGVTGQDHDSYPPPQGQARFDHMRMFLIGLLSQQSSYSEPTQKREGTTWFDLNELAVKIYKNGQWVGYSDAVMIGAATLTEWADEVSSAIISINPDVVFNGVCTANGTDQIGIPATLQSQIYADSRVFITVTSSAGVSTSVDPREVQLVGSPTPTTIVLINDELDEQDRFTVIIRRIPNSSFYTSTVSVP